MKKYRLVNFVCIFTAELMVIKIIATDDVEKKLSTNPKPCSYTL